MKPQAYRLKHNRFEYQAGIIVYRQLSPDYGLAGDDTRNTGIKHITVTTCPDGSYPGFTVPEDWLERLPSPEGRA